MTMMTTTTTTTKLDERGRSLAGDPEMIRLAEATARAMARRRGFGRHAEDLVSAALFGLVDAAARFDGDRMGGAASFRTFALVRVRGAVLDEMRRAANRGIADYAGRSRGFARVVSLSVPEGGDGDGTGRLSPTLGATVPDESLPIGWEVESEEEVRATLRPFGRDGAVAADYFLLAGCRLMREVADRHGVHESRVSQIVTSVLDRLRAGEGKSPPGPRHDSGRRCGCGRPIARRNRSGRCASCAGLERHARARERMRLEADRRIAAVLGRAG